MHICRYKYIFSEYGCGGNREADPRFIPLDWYLLIHIHSSCRITDTELLLALPFKHTEGCIFKPKFKTHCYNYFVFPWFGKHNRCPGSRVEADFLFLLFYMLFPLAHSLISLDIEGIAYHFVFDHRDVSSVWNTLPILRHKVLCLQVCLVESSGQQRAGTALAYVLTWICPRRAWWHLWCPPDLQHCLLFPWPRIFGLES